LGEHGATAIGGENHRDDEQPLHEDSPDMQINRQDDPITPEIASSW
jgi:hypothetical protein